MPHSVRVVPELARLEEDFRGLSSIVDPDTNGWTRTVFSEPYRASREYIRQSMAQAGLEVHLDAAGNVVGHLPGSNPGLPALMTGSHTDTVNGGGRFDGVVGVLGAVEAVRALREVGVALHRDLYVVDFLGEESNEFGLSCLGSRALAGDLTTEDLNRVDLSGATLGDRYRSFGLDPARAVAPDWARKTPLHRYVELHVEQGPLLEARGAQVGVVTAIAGIERLLAKFTGRPDHAGTMPMGDRRDALVAAAQAVLEIRREGCGAPVHGVATTSQVESSPGSPNVVPGEARLAAELRSVDPDWLSSAKARLARQIAENAHALGVEVELGWSHDNDFVRTSDDVQDAVVSTAEDLGLSWEAVPSGATHDAVHLAKLCPMGMIFVPSHGGRSHCPEEYTSLDQVSVGAAALAAVLQRLDGHNGVRQ